MTTVVIAVIWSVLGVLFVQRKISGISETLNARFGLSLLPSLLHELDDQRSRAALLETRLREQEELIVCLWRGTYGIGPWEESRGYVQYAHLSEAYGCRPKNWYMDSIECVLERHSHD